MTKDYLFYTFAVIVFLDFIISMKKFGFRRVSFVEAIDQFFLFRKKYRVTKDKRYLIWFILDMATRVGWIVIIIGIIFEY